MFGTQSMGISLHGSSEIGGRALLLIKKEKQNHISVKEGLINKNVTRNVEILDHRCTLFPYTHATFKSVSFLVRKWGCCKRGDCEAALAQGLAWGPAD